MIQIRRQFCSVRESVDGYLNVRYGSWKKKAWVGGWRERILVGLLFRSLLRVPPAMEYPPCPIAFIRYSPTE